DYPTIALNPLRVDTFSSSFPRRHKEFRLVATTNLFGDILSDQASGLAGGVGLAPSLNAGSDYAMAQAVHGTAPDIAGQGLANPVWQGKFRFRSPYHLRSLAKNPSLSIT